MVKKLHNSNLKLIDNRKTFFPVLKIISDKNLMWKISMNQFGIAIFVSLPFLIEVSIRL